MRFGTIALFGRSNVGKSTFLNAVLEQDLAIVSSRPQTTRDALLGVLTRDDVQMAFVDTPGVHRPKTELGRRMNHAAFETARTTDAVLFMTDVGCLLGRGKKAGEDPIDPEDRDLIQRLPAPKEVPTLLLLNKVDLLRDKGRLLPLLSAFQELRDFHAIIPLSALNADGPERVIEELKPLMPEGPAGYPADTLTDRPSSYFAREYVRESVLAATAGEVPHAVAVSVDSYEEGPVVRILATLHVDKVGQRRILVGNGGSKIKEIGSAARARIEALVGQKVYLELFVRVSPRWKDAPRQLAELGYSARGESDGRTPERK
ncbi:MAG TPA: GTPase Era [Polyangiaceae bacterium]|nr:GTPase Era [Polyangiaceae bacterium]